MKKVISVALITAVVISALFTGCGGSKGSNEGTTAQGSTQGTTQGTADQNKKITLMIWHDKGEVGINMLKEIGDLFSKKYPNVTVQSTTYPSQQFIEKSIAAINTNSAPDLMFNDWNRIIPIEQQTGKLLNVNDNISQEEKDMIGQAGLLLGSYNNKQIVYPNETSYISLAIRKSWLDKVNGKVPETLDEFIELGKKFVSEDPDGNGENDTFGFSGYFGKGALEFVRYFDLASGINDYVVNGNGEPTFNEATRKKILAKYAAMYNTDKIVPEDSVSHTYVEMYQFIEGSKVGMFRVGDWNVKKWDELFKGDYIIAPWPVLNKGDKPTAQLYTMVGCAIAQNAPNTEMSIKFAQFMNEKESQNIHFNYQGRIIRNDLTFDSLTANEKYFFEQIRGGKAGYTMIAPDTHASKFAYVPKIEEVYEKAIQKIISEKDADIDKTIAEAEKQALEIVKAEKK